ncbi:MAG: hypothetical protein ABIO79_14270 [Ferruginibacter sp.]
MATQVFRRDLSLWLCFILTFLLSGVLALLFLSEFIKIGILGRTGGYSFGGEGPVPTSYRTAEIYARVNLTEGLSYLILFLVNIWAFLKAKKKVIFAILILSVLLTLFLMGSAELV